MRICLASIHPRALSGQIDCLAGLARELTVLGHEVRVVSAFEEAALLHGDRLALCDGDGGALLPKVGRIRRILGALARHAAEADVVHFNLPTPAFALLADVLQMHTQTPVVVGYEAHLAPFGELLGSRRLLAAPLFYLPRLAINNALIARLTVRRAARYIVSSQMQAAELVATGADPARVVVIPNVIDAGKLPSYSRREARWQLGLPPGRLVVYIGHYHDVKGVDVLAAAFAHIARAIPEARLILAWSGLGSPRPVESIIAREGLSDRVVRFGKVDVAKALASADVVALPYRLSIGQAAYPGLVLETMVVGRPLVTTDLPLLRELVADSQTALLCPPDSPAALADSVLRLLADHELAGRLVAAQKSAMRRRFRPSLLTRQYEKVYEDVLAEQARVLRPALGSDLVRSAALRRAKRGMGEPARARVGPERAAADRKSA
ncbi:MAG: glycosyltransferase family 4 protein [Chloroflexi bacterium]|nr:glycosyltransferase family 4 protein [Chloroflexota bacterium]